MNEHLLQRMSVLYVEDDEVTKKNLTRFLERRVGRLFVAEDGERGVELFREHKPDILITDIRMPRMDGLTMIRRIREVVDQVPVVITTAYSDVDYLMQAIDLGVDKFIKKPIVHKQLLYTLEQIAVYLQHDYEIQKRNRMIETILDWHPCFVIWTEAANLEYINQHLLGFMGYSDPEDFFQRHKSIHDVIRHGSGHPWGDEKTEEWFQYIIEHPDTDHTVFLKNRDQWHEKEYLIRFHHFSGTDMYVFAFLDPASVPAGSQSRQTESLCL